MNNKPLTAMTSDRIKEIQSETAYPNSRSVKSALDQVWNECEQYYNSLHEPNQTPMNTDYIEQPFNLETALKHPEWVYFRNGEKPLEWHWFEKGEQLVSIPEIDKRTALISGIDGKHLCSGHYYFNYDLILRVPYMEVWVNINPHSLAYWYDSKELAEHNSRETRIACVPVKIPAIC